MGRANCYGMMKGDRWGGLTPLQKDALHVRRLGLPLRWENVAKPPAGYVSRLAPVLARLSDAAAAGADVPALRAVAADLTAPLLDGTAEGDTPGGEPGR